MEINFDKMNENIELAKKNFSNDVRNYIQEFFKLFESKESDKELELKIINNSYNKIVADEVNRLLRLTNINYTYLTTDTFCYFSLFLHEQKNSILIPDYIKHQLKINL